MSMSGLCCPQALLLLQYLASPVTIDLDATAWDFQVDPRGVVVSV